MTIDGPTVRVSGIDYPTVMDGAVQRFVADPVLAALQTCGALNLNTLAIAYHSGNSGLTKRQYAELNMKLGYSVCGFAELSTFLDMEIVNPMWST